MSGNEELLAQFMAITGINSERAKFYLEAAGWDMDAAMGSFYDNDESDVHVLEDGVVAAARQDEAPPPDPAPAPASAPIPASRPQRHQPGVRTIRGMQLDEESDDSEEDGQAFFAGGSEQSGQQILGPRRRRRGEDIVKEMFKAAKHHGAEEVEPAEAAAGPAGARPTVFTGAGYRLGQGSADSQMVPAAASTPRPPQPRTVKLRLWRSGFTVDDGELREFADPANQQFLSAIRAGQVPPELIREAEGGEVHLDMEDHRHEDYERPKAKVASFSGKGHVLGSPGGAAAADDAPAAAGWWHWLLSLLTASALALWHLFSPAPAVTGGGGGAAAAEAGGDPAGAEAAAAAALAVDNEHPVTSVQVRLLDGTRLVVKLNHWHTVGQLRRYITTARPQYRDTAFALMTTFPSKELTDDDVTIKDGQLLNAAVLQRAK